MTTTQVRTRWAPAVAAAILALAPPSARADEARTGDEPWYPQSSADARRKAQALFEQGLDKHLHLQRRDAKELYEGALALWDNPDIRWNLALVLDDLGEYLLADQQLASVLRWKDALGARRLREVHDLKQVLETRRLARLDVHGDDAGAQIKLDGKPWFTGAGDHSELVGPGDHYISASKPGYFPVTVPVFVTKGLDAHVVLAMDADRVIETRRWAWWKPWTVFAAGALVTLVGLGTEELALEGRRTAQSAVKDGCTPTPSCAAVRTPDAFRRAMAQHRLAIGEFGVGGSAAAIGLVLAWLNQLQRYRSEPRARSTIRLTPIVSSEGAGVSTVIRF